jgi:hypothetical protein
MGRSLSTSTFVSPNTVDLYHDLISNDPELKAVAGLKVEKIVDRRALASTSEPGNKRIIISKQRCGPFEWCAGGKMGQQREYIKIETIVKTVEGQEDAQQICDSIRQRMRRILFDAEFLGTGWLQHKEVQDQYPSPPMKTRAYHILIYECLCSIGDP